MDTRQVLERLTLRTRGVFLTHVLGYNALDRRLLDELARRRVTLLEVVCESLGATFEGRKLGTFGLMSNFSFYYAHHLSTVEGGMVCTNNSDFFECVRMFRSHGLVRESTSSKLREAYESAHRDLTPDFIFAFPAYNVRNTEINAVIGRSQLRRLNHNIEVRRNNLRLFLENLDPEKYRTDFEVAGNSNYALTLILSRPDAQLRDSVVDVLRRYAVEFRRGTSGGGNQLRQPYIKKLIGDLAFADYPNVDHVHFYGFYIGNYPELESERIQELCSSLNELSHAS